MIRTSVCKEGWIEFQERNWFASDMDASLHLESRFLIVRSGDILGFFQVPRKDFETVKGWVYGRSKYALREYILRNVFNLFFVNIY
jgi:hypothetical protein